jgi:quinol-cytochrome oxidoreductase complex cytochrome b subunit
MDSTEKSNLKESHGPIGLLKLGFRRPRWTHYLGSTAIFLLALQVVTGFLLLMYYQPNSRDAHDSVRAIMMDIPVGWVIRSLHRRCSHLLIFIIMLHVLDVLLAKMFRKKRSYTYYTGVVLLFCVLFMGFTGYLLPWDTLSVVATAVGTGLPNEIPLIGPYITEFFRGGTAIGAQTLPRFFALHISLIPMTIGLALVLHIVFIRRHGMRRPIGPYKMRVPFYPDFILRQILVCLWVFAILLTAAILLPTGLRPEGDPLAPAPVGIRPEWYFLAVFEAIRLGGHLTFLNSVGITAELLSLILLGGVIIVFALMPVLDSKGSGRAWKWIVRLAAVTFVVLTFYAVFRSAPEVKPMAEVAQRACELRVRTLGFLVPFWLSIVALTWIIASQIHLHDRITAAGLPAHHDKA